MCVTLLPGMSGKHVGALCHQRLEEGFGCCFGRGAPAENKNQCRT